MVQIVAERRGCSFQLLASEPPAEPAARATSSASDGPCVGQSESRLAASQELEAEKLLSKLLIKRRIPIAQQHHQRPDAQGGAEGELKQAEEGRDDGHDAAPLRCVRAGPTRLPEPARSATTTTIQAKWMSAGKPLRRQRPCAQGPFIQGPKWPERNAFAKASPQSPGPGTGPVDEPDNAERLHLARVFPQLELQGRAQREWRRNRAAAMWAKPCPGAKA